MHAQPKQQPANIAELIGYLRAWSGMPDECAMAAQPSHHLDHHELSKAGEVTILDATGENVLFASMASMDEESDREKEREREPAV